MKRERDIVRFAECTLAAELPATHQRRWAGKATEMKNGTKQQRNNREDGRDSNAPGRFWKERSWPRPQAEGRMSSRCGSRGVTSGPPDPQYMLTSLRTPNSPLR